MEKKSLIHDKKIVLFCSILIALLVVRVLGIVQIGSTTYSWIDETEQLTIGPEPEEFRQKDEKGNTSYYSFNNLSLRPKHAHKGEERPYLLSTVDGRTTKVELEKVRLVFPSSIFTLGTPTVCFVIFVVLFIMAICLWFLYTVFRLLRKLRRGEMFVTDVAQLMERAGWLALVWYLAQYLGYFVIYYLYISHLKIANYDIVYSNDSRIEYLYLSIVLLLFSRIILKGKELQDDLNLTI